MIKREEMSVVCSDGLELGLRPRQRAVKRVFDLLVASIALVVFSPVILVACLAARLDTRSSGFFRQQRVGLNGRLFAAVKIRTMRNDAAGSTVTVRGDPRVTRSGVFLRRFKLDELPQLWNVVVGNMSLVGPRPDVPGFADQLTGSDRLILTVRPGMTGPATLKYRDEEALLRTVPDPEAYNAEVIFPDKVRLNVEYVREYSFWTDIQILWKTLRGG